MNIADFQPGDVVKIRGQSATFRVISVGVPQGWVKVWGGRPGSGTLRVVSPYRLQLVQRPDPLPEPPQALSEPLNSEIEEEPPPVPRRPSPGIKRACRECEKDFTPPSKPGRPPLYCPDCQSKTTVRERARLVHRAKKTPPSS